jgi:hypothetical protein
MVHIWNITRLADGMMGPFNGARKGHVENVATGYFG